jgi:hypothetical protein
MQAARNRPCPCGSGKKYKLCCLRSEPAARYERADRESVLQALEQFVKTTVDIEASVDAFLEPFADDDLAEILELDLVHDAWLAWAILDDPDADVLAKFRRRYAGRLTPGQRSYLDCLATARMRVYTVVGVDLDQALHLRDLLDRENATVTERGATHQLVPGDVIAGRLIDGKAPGTIEIEHPVFPFTQLHAEALLRDVRSLRRRLRRNSDEALTQRMLRVAIPMLVNAYWIDRLDAAADLRARGMSAVSTPEGDPIAFHAVTFEVRDREALLERLHADEQFVASREDHFAWLEPDGDQQRVLGDLRLAQDELRGEVISAERAERLRDELSLLAGEHAVFRTIKEIDPSAHEHEPAPVDAPDLSAEEQARVVGEFYARHYASWPDESLPIFEGLTPREAAKRPDLRGRLVALLRDMDASSERQRLAGEFGYDFTPIWRELGLERSRIRRPLVKTRRASSASRPSQGS